MSSVLQKSPSSIQNFVLYMLVRVDLILALKESCISSFLSFLSFTDRLCGLVVFVEVMDDIFVVVISTVNTRRARVGQHMKNIFIVK